ncbi:SHOCT domain-containing protein [Lentibacillus sp. N15]|uniref:SHOCT domain-containing protein n=1 Tax=Lentibacillus songyuanensis TaxID=3136161 RepID=UPI0031BA6D58
MYIFSAFSIRLVISIIIAIVLLWILFRFRANKNDEGSSLEIMQERLEKGEISQEEYDKARRKQGK